MICSSQPQHYEHLVRTIAAGKAIFVEKPMVTRLEDYKQIVGLMATRSLLVTLGLNRRYSAMIRKLVELVDGPVDSVTYFITQPFRFHPITGRWTRWTEAAG